MLQRQHINNSSIILVGMFYNGHKYPGIYAKRTPDGLWEIRKNKTDSILTDDYEEVSELSNYQVFRYLTKVIRDYYE